MGLVPKHIEERDDVADLDVVGFDVVAGADD
jgi:hypothetical protein